MDFIVAKPFEPSIIGSLILSLFCFSMHAALRYRSKKTTAAQNRFRVPVRPKKAPRPAFTPHLLPLSDVGGSASNTGPS